MSSIKEWEEKILAVIKKNHKKYDDLGKPYLIEHLLFLETEEGRHLKSMMKKNNANKNAVLFLEEYHSFSMVNRRDIEIAFNKLLDKQRIHDSGQKIEIGPPNE